MPNATTSLRKISMEEKSQSGHFSVYYYVKCCTEARVPKITTTEGLYVIILTGLFLLFDGVAGHEVRSSPSSPVVSTPSRTKRTRGSTRG